MSISPGLIYAGTGQVSAVVPLGIQGHANTQVQVEYQGAPSPPVTIPVVNARPGIFPADSSGKGAAASGAAAGSTIVLYATGGRRDESHGGRWRNRVRGAIEGGAERLGGVAGLDAAVIYAGVSPGIVAGVTVAVR